MQTVRSALIVIAFSLLAVGLLRGTLVRQVIQIVPILMALRLTSRFPGYLGAYAAVSISAFWMLVMAFVWLSALGFSDLLPGPYAPIEIRSQHAHCGVCLGGRLSRSPGWTAARATS